MMAMYVKIFTITIFLLLHVFVRAYLFSLFTQQRSAGSGVADRDMSPDSLPRLWRCINLLLTYLPTYLIFGIYGKSADLS